MSHQIGLRASLWYGLLISDCYGQAQFTVSSATPGLVVLSVIRKQAKQAIRSKPVSSTPSWPLHGPTSRFLP